MTATAADNQLPFTIPDLTAQVNVNANELTGGEAAQGWLSSMPLQFIRNEGQSDDSVRFQILSNGGSIFFTDNGVSFRILNFDAENLETAYVRYRFAGATGPSRISGDNQLNYRVNFLHGNNPSEWNTGVAAYEGITYHDLYPGVDLSYRGVTDGLKSEFVLSPGANPSIILI
jgi:hypothetical protein